MVNLQEKMCKENDTERDSLKIEENRRLFTAAGLPSWLAANA
jgi:hypothetical protein